MEAAVEPAPVIDLPPLAQAVLAAVPDWWAKRAAIAGLSGSWLDVHQALSVRPPTDLEHVGPVEIDASSHALGQAYVEALSPATRASHGRHYTPEVLAERLWTMGRNALGWKAEDHQLSGLVRDPACGAGALLLPPLREHLRASYDADPSLTLAALPNRVHGVDQDPWAVYLANVVLAAEALPTLARVPEKLRRPFPALATVGDGLSSHLPKALVSIMNPPYGRLKLADADRARFSHALYGHANLYAVFMAAGAANLTEGGVLATLVPTSFTSGLYFHRLRSFLANEAPLTSLTFVHERSGVFSGVLQETCLAVFSRKRARRVEVTRSNGSIVPVATVPSPRGSAPWFIPRESDDAALAAAASALPLTLKDAGWHASTGPLVWNRRKEDLRERAGKNRAHIVWGADIDGGVVHRDTSRDRTRYLELNVASDTSVMVLDEPAILVQRTTAPEQTKRLVVADLPAAAIAKYGGRVIVENHVNVLRATLGTPLISRETLALVLATPTFDRLMRCISGSVAVSSYELATLPLPDARTLQSWELLRGGELEKAVAAAYRVKTTR
jgi:adenine-specific DNA-methyltransferase